MRIKCLGGFREVGRNAVLIESNEKSVLDYGIKVETGEAPLPAEKVDNVILGHAHLDHSGAIPSLFENSKPRVFATIATFKDRKSTRLNSSHRTISYAVFCLKKK